MTVQFRGVRKVFGAKVVLDWVDLSLAQGEVVALLGPNGAGKTTLLKIAATLLRPSGGSISVAGHDALRETELVRRRIGFLAHRNYLYEDLTAYENLRFWTTLAGLDTSGPRLQAALALVELDSVAHDLTRTFSAGMKRRLALARILLRTPALLLLDEPFDGLDQRGKTWLEQFLRAFAERGGAALFATHSFERSLGIADRVVILAAGRVVLDRPRAVVNGEELHRLYALHTEEVG